MSDSHTTTYPISTTCRPDRLLLFKDFGCPYAGGWRNGLVFDPLEEYGTAGLSYAEFFLYPLADALSQAMSSTTKVLFAMQVSSSPQRCASQYF